MKCKENLNNSNLLGRVNILQSFYSIKKWQKQLIKLVNSFMLDSGAFSFMQNKKLKQDWASYTDKYIDYINENDIELFFELDIDSIVGYDNVIKLRNKIESKTGKQTIPVWHKSRGKDNFIEMCKDYNYVALGGIVTGEIKRTDNKFFNGLCDIAHSHNAKIHGLGFAQAKLENYRFDSVDTAAWLYGNIGGFLYKFNGKEIIRIDKPEGTRIKSKEVAIHNFWEWVKYGEYLNINCCLAGVSSRPYVFQNRTELNLAATKSEKGIFYVNSI